jgi:type IV secretory pathway TraG/TraD family ATPase VirD4
MILLIVILLSLVIFYYKSFDGPEGFANSFFINNPFNTGFSIAGGSCAISREDSFRHCLCAAITGAGKSAGPLFGSLMTLTKKDCSIVVLDIAKANYQISSGDLSLRRGRKIYCFDLSTESACFNPLHTAKDVTDLERIIHTIIENSDVISQGDKFWSTSAEMILVFFLEVMFQYQPKESLTLCNLALLIDRFFAEPQVIDRLIVETQNDQLIERYKTINAMPEKVRDSVLSVCVATLKLFKSPDIARCTGSNSFSFESFRKENTILYLAIPISRLAVIAPLLALFFETFLAEGMSHIPAKNEKDLFLLIDEAVLFKFSLGILLSQSRKFRIGVLLLIQTPKMFEMRYSKGECTAILENIFTQVYLPGQNLEVCKELKEIIGRRKIEKTDKSIIHGDYILEASELRVLEKAVVVQAGRVPMLLRIIPFFKHFTYSKRAKIPPRHDNPPQQIPRLLQL